MVDRGLKCTCLEFNPFFSIYLDIDGINTLLKKPSFILSFSTEDKSINIIVGYPENLFIFSSGNPPSY